MLRLQQRQPAAALGAKQKDAYVDRKAPLAEHARQDSNLQPSVPEFMQPVRNGNGQDLNLTFGS